MEEWKEYKLHEIGRIEAVQLLLQKIVQITMEKSLGLLQKTYLILQEDIFKKEKDL